MKSEATKFALWEPELRKVSALALSSFSFCSHPTFRKHICYINAFKPLLNKQKNPLPWLAKKAIRSEKSTMELSSLFLLFNGHSKYFTQSSPSLISSFFTASPIMQTNFLACILSFSLWLSNLLFISMEMPLSEENWLNKDSCQHSKQLFFLRKVIREINRIVKVPIC